MFALCRIAGLIPTDQFSREEMTSFDKIIKSLQSSLKAVQESPVVSELDFPSIIRWY